MKKKIFYVQIDDELTSIYDQLKGVSNSNLVLVVPKKAVLFQSVVNLLLLNKKLSKKDNKILIITKDRQGIHMAAQAKIPTASKIKMNDPSKKMAEEDSMDLTIKPITASKNVFKREENPKRMSDKKMSIRGLIEEFRMKNSATKSANKKYFDSIQYMIPGKKIFFGLLAVSISLFLFILYIALPSATVYIKPKFSQIDFSLNITLADNRTNQNLIRTNDRVLSSEKIKTTVRETKVFKSTSKDFKGKNATGFITLINTTDQEWQLKGGTRFQNEEGIVFRMKSYAVVPASTTDIDGVSVPGEVLVPVEADPFDIYSKPVGKRGNIPPDDFILPGLSEFYQSQIYGRSSKSMKGGFSNYTPIISQSDLDSAKNQIESNLKDLAKRELENYLTDINQLNQTHLILFDDLNFLETRLIEMRFSDDLVGSEKEKFEIFAEIEVEAIVFDEMQLFNLLKKELSSRTHPNMQLRSDSVDTKNISYQVVEQDEDSGLIKLTVSLSGIEEFSFEESTLAGQKISDLIRSKIAGLEVNQALNLIGNMPEVDSVEIKSWPIWLKSIPSFSERISIKLLED